MYRSAVMPLAPAGPFIKLLTRNLYLVRVVRFDLPAQSTVIGRNLIYYLLRAMPDSTVTLTFA